MDGHARAYFVTRQVQKTHVAQADRDAAVLRSAQPPPPGTP
jgi:hypothetical protein